MSLIEGSQPNRAAQTKSGRRNNTIIRYVAVSITFWNSVASLDMTGYPEKSCYQSPISGMLNFVLIPTRHPHGFVFDDVIDCLAYVPRTSPPILKFPNAQPDGAAPPLGGCYQPALKRQLPLLMQVRARLHSFVG